MKGEDAAQISLSYEAVLGTSHTPHPKNAAGVPSLIFCSIPLNYFLFFTVNLCTKDQLLAQRSYLFRIQPSSLMGLFICLWQVADYFNAFPSDVLAIFDEVLHRTGMELLEKPFPENSGGNKTKCDRMRHTLHTRITGKKFYWEL